MADASATPQIFAGPWRVRPWTSAIACGPPCRCRPAACTSIAWRGGLVSMGPTWCGGSAERCSRHASICAKRPRPSSPRSTDIPTDDVMASRETTIHRQAKGYRWEGVEELPYKEDDRALFKSVTRQVLFADPKLYGEL